MAAILFANGVGGSRLMAVDAHAALAVHGAPRRVGDLMEHSGYANRSEAVRDPIRCGLGEAPFVSAHAQFDN